MGFEGISIISGICPSSICCQLADGCDYIEDSKSLCAKNRDPESILCSQCLDGYSESVTSKSCHNCRRGDYWQYILLSFVLASSMTTFYIMTNTVKTYQSTTVIATGVSGRLKWLYSRLQNSSGDQTLLGLFQISVYYEQVIVLIVYCCPNEFGLTL